MRVGFPKQKVYIDEEIFDLILQGKQDAFKQLYDVSYKPLYAFLLSLTQNAEDAKDLLHDTYIQIWSNCHLYKKQGNPMAWMMKIAKNLFLMKCRKETQQVEMSYDDIEQQLGLEVLTDAENRLLLEKMFSSLSNEERDIIVMHEVNGLKYREIANLLDKPIGTILAKYNRGIRKLKKEFSEE